MKKKVTFLAQSKGGVGKSFITWFIARSQKDATSIFIDLDKSTRTSQRLKSLVGNDRILELSIMDGNLKMDREAFLNIFANISKTETEEWYVDLGAPESDELKSFFKNEVSGNELKEILDDFDIDLRILVIIAGEDAFAASVSYYKELSELAGDFINIVAIKNEGTFGTIENREQGDQLLLDNGISFIKAGVMPIGNSGNEIINIIAGINTEENLSFAGKRSMKKVTEQIELALL